MKPSPVRHPYFSGSQLISIVLLLFLLRLARCEVDGDSDQVDLPTSYHNLRPSILPSSIFQDPPKPMVVWADPPERPLDFQRPKRWKEKNFGQWCRNFTINRHTQCPPASPFHWFVCCGDGGVECCGGIQTWAYFVFGSLIMSAIIIFSFYVLLKFDLICQQSTWPTDRDNKKECEKMVESPGKTRPSTPCSTLLSSQSSSDNSPSMSPAHPSDHQARDEVTLNLTDVESRDPECHSDMKVVVVDGPQRRL